MNDDFFESLLQFAVQFSQLTDNLLSQAKPEMLTPLQFRMLQIIAEDQSITLSDLCGCSHVSMPNGSRELKKLLDLKLVEKLEAPGDKRKQLLVLTVSGQNVIADAYATIKGIVAERYKTLSDEELKELTVYLKILGQKLI